MPIDLLVNAENTKPINVDKAITVIADFHDPTERHFFELLLGMADKTPIPFAIVVGIPKDSPLDPSPDTTLARTHEIFDPGYGGHEWRNWEILEHRQYMVLPHNEVVRPVTPLYSVEKYSRIWVGQDIPHGISNYSVVSHNAIRYDEGRSHGIEMVYDRAKLDRLFWDTGVKYAKELGLQEIMKCCDILPVEFGYPHISPKGISSRHITELRDKIKRFIDEGVPKGYVKTDFWTDGLADLVPKMDRRLGGNWMAGFYQQTQLVFINPKELRR